MHINHTQNFSGIKTKIEFEPDKLKPALKEIDPDAYEMGDIFFKLKYDGVNFSVLMLNDKTEFCLYQTGTNSSSPATTKETSLWRRLQKKLGIATEEKVD